MRLILTQPRLKAFDNAHNLDAVRSALDAVPDGIRRDDIVVLPEHVYFPAESREYFEVLGSFAKETGCVLLGGSFHEITEELRRNTGAIFASDGSVICHYDKLRPYADERERVDAGTRLGVCELGGHRIMVLICADFWFSDLYANIHELPELVLVPALSVTRKPSPDYSRSLWRHLAISRAYEFGVYVGISDWAADSELPRLRTSGVGGFADGATSDPGCFYRAIGDERVLVTDIDFDVLAAFRADREERGFFWKRNSR